MNSRARDIKEASQIGVGESEDEAKERVKALMAPTNKQYYTEEDIKHMETQTCYIDADSLLYRAAYLATRDDTPEVGEDNTAEEIDLATSANEQLEDASRIFHSMVKDIMAKMPENTPFYHVLTVKTSSSRCKNWEPNFRYDLMAKVPNIKGYKHSREGKPVPDGLADLYDYVFDLENTICIEGIEADDYVVYQGNQGHIVAALDKDVIHSLPMAYNYNKGEWVDSDPESIRKWFWKQVITGDSGDGIRGIVRVGDKGADKMLKGIANKTDYEVWAMIVKAYVMKDQTVEEAIATARAVCMTQWSEDKGLELWQPPKK